MFELEERYFILAANGEWPQVYGPQDRDSAEIILHALRVEGRSAVLVESPLEPSLLGGRIAHGPWKVEDRVEALPNVKWPEPR